MRLVLNLRSGVNNALRSEVASQNSCPFHSPNLDGQLNLAYKLVKKQQNVAKEQPQTVSSYDEFKNARPFSEIPVRKTYPLIDRVVKFLFGSTKAHEEILANNRKYGPVYKEKFGTCAEVIFIGDFKGIKNLSICDGNEPHTYAPPVFSLWEEVNKIKRGIFFMNGEEWATNRKILNKELMLDMSRFEHAYKHYLDIIKEEHDSWYLSGLKNGGIVPQEKEKIYILGFKCFGAFVFGDLFDKHKELMNSFAIDAQKSGFMLFNGMDKTLNFSPELAYKLNIKSWKEFNGGLLKLREIGRSILETAKNDMKSESPEKLNGLYHRILKNGEMSIETTHRIIDEFPVGLDPEANMHNWAIYSVGRHPEVQEKIYAEIKSVLKNRDDELNYSDLDSTPYLTAVLKETFRMYPTTALSARITNNDGVISGYQVPKGTLVSVSMFSAQRDPKIYLNPDTFWPERWLRDKETRKMEGVLMQDEAYPFLAFNYIGRRGCIFRKATTKNLKLFLGKLVERYEVETSEVKPVFRSMVITDRSMKLKLKKRDSK